MTGEVAGHPGADDDADADGDARGDGDAGGAGDAGGDDERRWWQRRGVRPAAMVLGILVGFALAAGLGWLVRAPDARPEDRRAVLEDPDLEVVYGDDVVTLRPADGGGDPTPGLTIVFYPGAGVPPDAYLATWAPVVEETGASVLLPAMPLRLAVLDRDVAEQFRGAATRVRGEVPGSWFVGGHSLGGAMAASFVAGAPAGAWDGLVLWAAYPSGDALADRDDLAVLSVFGSRDASTTPGDIEATRDALPDGTDFVRLEGVDHDQFGAYGGEGDGTTAGAGDEEARTAIADATVAFLREVG